MTQTTVRRSDNSIKSVVVNRYDALDRRVVRESGSSVTKYAYDNEDIIFEFDSNNTIKAIYLHGPGVDEPIAMARDLNNNGSFEESEVFFYSKDHLNSVHDLLDHQGKPIQRYNYSAYGQTKIEKLTQDQKMIYSPYGYTSREWEQETGDYYYRARNYDPRSGRFISEDPIGFEGGDLNLYRYAQNNVINRRDPSGLDTFMCTSWEGDFPHTYIWITGGKNGGLTPANEISKITAMHGSTPGGDQGGPAPGTSDASCEKVKTKNKSQSDCLDQCVGEILDSPRPNYSIRGAGMACKEFVRRTITGCLAVCTK